ncbi:hypothetical protein AC579_3011 [Pseudocercospora musae]|uniref:Uncharacterized protein n=1 Tax=Pseudocercospora musae TaxID=113226 RepID=A0A139GSX4_9PEZI|nr:hypothetical protein AC579_3011 [Pseudocercospora musae]
MPSLLQSPPQSQSHSNPPPLLPNTTVTRSGGDDQDTTVMRWQGQDAEHQEQNVDDRSSTAHAQKKRKRSTVSNFSNDASNAHNLDGDGDGDTSTDMFGEPRRHKNLRHVYGRAPTSTSPFHFHFTQPKRRRAPDLGKGSTYRPYARNPFHGRQPTSAGQIQSSPFATTGQARAPPLPNEAETDHVHGASGTHSVDEGHAHTLAGGKEVDKHAADGGEPRYGKGILNVQEGAASEAIDIKKLDGKYGAEKEVIDDNAERCKEREEEYDGEGVVDQVRVDSAAGHEDAEVEEEEVEDDEVEDDEVDDDEVEEDEVEDAEVEGEDFEDGQVDEDANQDTIEPESSLLRTNYYGPEEDELTILFGRLAMYENDNLRLEHLCNLFSLGQNAHLLFRFSKALSAKSGLQKRLLTTIHEYCTTPTIKHQSRWFSDHNLPGPWSALGDLRLPLFTIWGPRIFSRKNADALRDCITKLDKANLSLQDMAQCVKSLDASNVKHAFKGVWAKTKFDAIFEHVEQQRTADEWEMNTTYKMPSETQWAAARKRKGLCVMMR